MSAGFDLPRTGLAFAARIREQVGASPVQTRRELLPRALHSVCRWRYGDGGRLECQRQSSAGPTWREPTPALFAKWARELSLGVDPVRGGAHRDDQRLPRRARAPPRVGRRRARAVRSADGA